MATAKQKLFNTAGRKATYVDEWFQISAGAFVSFEWRDFTVHGRTVRAANFLHAKVIVLSQFLRESGSCYTESGQCDLCGAGIQNVVVFQDSEDGKYLAVGVDCAGFLESNFNRAGFERRKKESEIKKAKNGNFYHSRKAPWWIWNAQRPAWLSVRKNDRPGGRGEWYVFVWGETKEEVFHRLAEFSELKKTVEDGLRAK